MFILDADHRLVNTDIENGIPRAVAYRTCAQAVMGAGKMVLESGLHPAALTVVKTTTVYASV